MTLNVFIDQYTRVSQILDNTERDESIPRIKRDGMAIVADEWLRSLIKQANRKQLDWIHENYPMDEYRYR